MTTRHVYRYRWPLFHDGRQPRQFHRSRVLSASGICAVREHRRPGADHLSPIGEGARLVVWRWPIGPCAGAAYSRSHAMSRTKQRPFLTQDLGQFKAPRPPQGIAAPKSRVRPRRSSARSPPANSKSTSAIVSRLRAARRRLPISRAKRPRPRRPISASEFLGDHVLGLVVSEMLFRAFPRADEGELWRRLADLVRKRHAPTSQNGSS